MKSQHSVWASLVVAALVSPFASSEAQASPPVTRSGFGSGVFLPLEYPFGGYGPMPIMSNPIIQPQQTWSYQTMPTYNPYIAPYPAFGILPPPFMTERSWNRTAYTGKTAEDYGYSRDSVDPSPRQRPTLYPAIPFKEAEEKRLVDAMRVKFFITVPEENAVVLMDGAKTKQTGKEREFVTPPIAADKLFSSTIEVHWVDERGQKKSRIETFEFIAGESVRYTFK
jgi:uncharacterized protein (TIGR03000 family)